VCPKAAGLLAAIMTSGIEARMLDADDILTRHAASSRRKQRPFSIKRYARMIASAQAGSSATS